MFLFPRVGFCGSEREHHISWSPFSLSSIRFLTSIGHPRDCGSFLLNLCKVKSSRCLRHSPSFLLSDKRASSDISFRIIFARTSHQGRWASRKKCWQCLRRQAAIWSRTVGFVPMLSCCKIIYNNLSILMQEPESFFPPNKESWKDTGVPLPSFDLEIRGHSAYVPWRLPEFHWRLKQ